MFFVDGRDDPGDSDGDGVVGSAVLSCSALFYENRSCSKSCSSPHRKLADQCSYGSKVPSKVLMGGCMLLTTIMTLI